MLKKLFHINVVLAVILLSGCATTLTGPNFKSVESVPTDGGLVYVYWTDRPESSIRQDFDMLANGAAFTTIKHGGYFAYNAKPGPMDLEASVNFSFGSMGALDVGLTFNEHVNFNIENGNTYFVRCTMAGGKGQRKLPMKLVDEKRGLFEIKKAKLLPPILAEGK